MTQAIRDQVAHLRADIGRYPIPPERANALLDSSRCSAIRAFAQRNGMIASVAANLPPRDCAQVYNVAVKCANSGLAFDSLLAMFRRIEAANLLGTPPTHPPATFQPIAPSVDMSQYVTKPEARDIAQSVLDAAGDDLCRQAALAARDSAMATVQAAIDSFKATEPVTLIVQTPSVPAPITMGLVHRKTPDIIKALAAGENVYLHGPAGSGKTTVALKAAKAFSLAFYFAAKVESEYLLLGYNDAKGRAVRTQFREAYEHGGVFLFDELDGSSPSAIVALNAALANGMCSFPDGVVQRHADFKCIAAGNTQLRGATGAYTGRAQLDAASIDRFVFVEFGYDEAMELELAQNKHWARYVQAVRSAVNDRSMGDEILITPRATISGCSLLAAGFDAETVKSMTVYKGLDEATRDQIERAVSVPFTDATIQAEREAKEALPFGEVSII